MIQIARDVISSSKRLRREEIVPELIYRCDDFEVIRRDGDSDMLLVTFSSLGMFNAAGSVANGKVFWAQKLAEKFDYAAIGFVAKERNWFCSSHMEEACASVAYLASNYKQVVAYGSSMGAYAALRWGKRAGAATVVAFSPQFSIDPAVGDARWAYAFRPEIHRGMEIQSTDVRLPSFLFVDPSDMQDMKHAELIRENVPGIIEVPLLSCGHECIRVFARSEFADRLLRLCATSDPDGVRALAREARKASTIRPVELANRLLAHKRNTAERIFFKYNSGFEIAQKSAFLGRLQETKGKSPATKAAAGDTNPFATATVSAACAESDSWPKPEPRTVPPMFDDRPRLIHMHVPKTAGTALRAAFEQQFHGKLRIFPDWHEGKYAGVNPDDFDFYSGHIGFDTASRLGGDIVTVLRHPVDRFISVYYFWQNLYETGVEKTPNTELAYRYTLDDFARIRDQPGLIEEFQNRCTFQVAYGSSLAQRRQLRIQGLTDDAIFNKATDNLAQCRVVGIQENMGRFADSIAKTFGVALNIRKVNVTQGRVDGRSISISTRRVIQDWVYMDIELYQHALRMA